MLQNREGRCNELLRTFYQLPATLIAAVTPNRWQTHQNRCQKCSRPIKTRGWSAYTGVKHVTPMHMRHAIYRFSKAANPSVHRVKHCRGPASMPFPRPPLAHGFLQVCRLLSNGLRHGRSIRGSHSKEHKHRIRSPIHHVSIYRSIQSYQICKSPQSRFRARLGPHPAAKHPPFYSNAVLDARNRPLLRYVSTPSIPHRVPYAFRFPKHNSKRWTYRRLSLTEFTEKLGSQYLFPQLKP